MKTITVPNPVFPHVPGSKELFKQPDGSHVSVSFKEFCETCLLSDARWVRSFADVKAALAFSAQLEKSEISLEDSDYEKLKACVESPTNGYQGYHPAVIQQFYPFMRAILETK